MQPDDQLGNGGAPAPQPVPPAPLPPQQPPMPAQQPVPPQAQPAPVQPQEQSPLQSEEFAEDQPADELGYDAGEYDDEEYEDEGEIDLSEPVNWQAKEYIHQEKDMKWFVVFALIIAIFMAIAVLLMKSVSFAILLVVIAVVVVVLAKRPPRVMEYSLSNEGLHIGETLHRFTDFKSFGVIRDGEEFSVMLIPRRRLQPGITVYFPEESGEDIVDALGSRLPMRDLHLDIVDRLVRKLRL
jgi:hypothetical protein